MDIEEMEDKVSSETDKSRGIDCNATNFNMSPKQDITDKHSNLLSGKTKSFCSEKDVLNKPCESTEINNAKHGRNLNAYDCNKIKNGNQYRKRFIFTFKLQTSHVIKKKHGNKVYGCEVCGKTYLHVFSLKRHFLRNHVNTKYLSEADISNCKIKCQDMITTEVHSSEDSVGSLNNSVTEHSEDADDPLSPSDVSLETNENFVNDLYRCHNCLHSKFASCAEVRNHYEQHLGGSKTQFTCEKCGATFSQQQAFVRHQSSHSEKSSFVCSACNLSFNNKKSYSKHSITHSNAKICKHCSKVFSTSANRRRHERIHEGLKPYPCKHCNIGFTQSNNLKTHIQEQHSELYFACSECSKLHASQASLAKHLIEIHSIVSSPNLPSGFPNEGISSDLTQISEKNSKPIFSSENIPKSSVVVKKSLSLVAKSAKLPGKNAYPCTVCKKTFRSYLYMMRHRSQMHPFLHRKRRPHRKKIELPKAKRILRNKAPPPEALLQTEDEFYLSVSQRIADNLVNYVDGRSSQLSLKQSDNAESFKHVKDSYISSLESLSLYNFPSNFDLGNFENSTVVKAGISNSLCPDDSAVVPLSFDDETHMNGNHFNNDDENDNCEIQLPHLKAASHQNLSLEERKALIGRVVPITYICAVCVNRFDSMHAFEDHKLNNHPNVLCTFIEIEGSKNIPPTIPPDLVKQFLSPLGILQHCPVPPSITHQNDLICTKCKSKFSTLSDLHLHIIACGGNEVNVSSFHHRRRQRRIKRTMKNRIDTAHRHACITQVVDGGYIPKYSNVMNKKKKNVQFLSKRNNKKNSYKTGSSVAKLQSGESKNLFVCSGCENVFEDDCMLKVHVNECFQKVDKKLTVINPINAEDKCVDELDVCTLRNNEESHSQSPENLSVPERHSSECIGNFLSSKNTFDDSNFHLSTLQSNKGVRALNSDQENRENLELKMVEESKHSDFDNCDKSAFGKCSEEICKAEDLNPEATAESSSVSGADPLGYPVDAPNNELQNSLVKICSNVLENTNKDKDENSDFLTAQQPCNTVDNGLEVKEVKEIIGNNTGLKKKDEEQARHTCPKCLLDFSYLTNYHRHLATCKPEMLRQSSSTNASLPHLPKKDEVESSMLHLLRHQSRQSQMLREAESKPTSSGKRFQSYTCDVCHKIFLSYFEMLRHSMSHKLNSEENLIPQSDNERSQSKGKVNVDNQSEEHISCNSMSSTDERCDPIKNNCDLNTAMSKETLILSPETEQDVGLIEEEISQEIKMLHKNKKRKKTSIARSSKYSNIKPICNSHSKNPTVVKLEHSIVEDSSLSSLVLAPLLPEPAKHKTGNSDCSNQSNKPSEAMLPNHRNSGTGKAVSSGSTPLMPEAHVESSHSQDDKIISPSDNTCIICNKIFSSYIYKKRHMNFMHKERANETTEGNVDKGNFAKKRGRKKTLTKNNRQVFQRECKKQTITKTVNSKVHDSKKVSSVKKSVTKKSPQVKKRNSR